MQDSLHTSSPLAANGGKLRSYRGMAVALVLIAIVICGVVIFLIQSKKASNPRPLTNEERANIVAEWGTESSGESLTNKEREAIVESQTSTTVENPRSDLTDEQRAEIINGMSN